MFQNLLLVSILLYSSTSLFAGNKNTASKAIMEQKYHKQILAFVDSVSLQKYQSAKSILSRFPKKANFTIFLSGLLSCTIFNDYGDTTELLKAEAYWEELHNKLETGKNPPSSYKETIPASLYHGLCRLQLGYIASIKKKQIKAVMHARSGVKMLRKHPGFYEAQCAVHTYEYYQKNLFSHFSWLPFVDTDKTVPRMYLKKNFAKSHYYQSVYLNPLIWFHFDAGLYEEGLKLTQDFLDKYPGNRIFTLIKADFLYKLGRYADAAKIFESTKKEYLHLYKTYPNRHYVPINYLSAVGNLVRVYASMENIQLQKENADIWFSSETQKLEDWLPRSLLKDLKKYKGGK
ncbi:MAG: tetratricopeptide repeat protein [Fibrobacteria bacterium]|nr:tetratricopeptide repeat protein [Fibrobacteria bacterium]